MMMIVLTPALTQQVQKATKSHDDWRSVSDGGRNMTSQLSCKQNEQFGLKVFFGGV